MLVSPIAARSKFLVTIGLVCVFLTTRLRGSSSDDDGDGDDDDDDDNSSSSSVPRCPSISLVVPVCGW